MTPDEVVLSSYGDIQEVLTSADFVQDNTHPRTPIFAGSIMTLDGAQHRARRRVETPLVSRSAIQAYAALPLGPALEAAIQKGEAVRTAGTNRVQVDLVGILRRMMYTFAATVTGIDVDGSGDGIDRFIALQERMGRGAGVSYDAPSGQTMVDEALAEREVFRAQYLEPSLARRAAVIAAGEVPPVDLLSLMIGAGLGSEAMSEAVLFFLASTGTSARVIPHAVVEITRWQTEHADAVAGPDDPTFLGAAADEALRVHPPTPAVYRRCRQGHRLASGHHIDKGRLVRLDIVQANRDPAVWGADAAAFDPMRPTPPGLRPWGLTFGAGPHTCLGQPAATGTRDGGRSRGDGLVARVLGALYDAEVEQDPRHAPRRVRIGHFEAFETFPVILTVPG